MTELSAIEAELVDGLSLPQLSEVANRYHAEAEASAHSAVDFAWHAGQVLSTKTVDRLTERGIIRAYPLGPRLLRYDLNEIDAALVAASTEGTPTDA